MSQLVLISEMKNILSDQYEPRKIFDFCLHLIFSFYPTWHLALAPVFIIISDTSNIHLLLTPYLNYLNYLSPEQSHFFLLLLLLNCFTIYSCSFMRCNSVHVLAILSESFYFLTWKTWLSLQILKYLRKASIIALERKLNRTQNQWYTLHLQLTKSSHSAKSKSIFVGLSLASLLPKGCFSAKLLLLLPPISTFFRLFKTQVYMNPVCIYINIPGRKRSNATDQVLVQHALKNKQFFPPVLPVKLKGDWGKCGKEGSVTETSGDIYLLDK